MTDDELTITLPFIEDRGPADTSQYVGKNQWWPGNKGIVAIATATGQSYWETREGLERAQETLRMEAKQQRTKDKYDEHVPHKFHGDVAKLYFDKLGWWWVPSNQSVSKGAGKMPTTVLTWEALPEEALMGPVVFRTRSWICVVAGIERGPWPSVATKPRPYFGYWCPKSARAMVASMGRDA